VNQLCRFLLTLVVLLAAPAALPAGVAPAANLTVPAGFKAELVYQALQGEGSWACLTVDPRGRLIVSPQEISYKDAAGNIVEGGLLRLTLSATGAVQRIERIHLPVGAAMGLLHAFDSLYVNGQGPAGTGLYRLRDTDGDDQFDEWKLLKKFEGWFRERADGEHGPHAVVLGPDDFLYVINGNETKPPANFAPHSPHKNFAEDQLNPPWLWPANYGWANGAPPGGYVARTDRDGNSWSLVCGGLRNACDLAFNRDGEMFTFDSDMDWDDGAPWYRPTRINHLVSGGEYGWRKGTGKWPDYYADSLPTTLDLGRSSPTGVKFGTLATNFPPRYRRMMFACDWAFGTIYAAQLTPDGASYKATAEPFVTGRPLNVTDLEFGADGAMYFITGGRGTGSALYRVTWAEPMTRDPVLWGYQEQTALKARALRHKLESLHGRRDPTAVDFAWPHLGSDDAWLRYAARIAVEWQDVNLWRDRALAETNGTAGLTALLALARCDDGKSQPALLKTLATWPLDSLDEEHKLLKLRVIQLSCIRQGKPGEELRKLALEKLGHQFPSASRHYDRELCRLLVYFEAPDVVAKTVKLLASTPSQEDQLHYAFTLRQTTHGWTPELRRAYFEWFPKAAAHFRGSAKFLGFLEETRKEAAKLVPDSERAALAKLLSAPLTPAPVAAAKSRPFVKEWKMDDLDPLLPGISSGRDFERGREIFATAQCAACHRFADSGGASGPDISTASSRYTRRDLAEAILLPSKVISDQFLNTTFVKQDGGDVTGRVVEEDNEKVVVLVNPLENTHVTLSKTEVASIRPSTISPMPEGLLNSFTRDQLLDLLAYLESQGNPNYPSFRKP